MSTNAMPASQEKHSCGKSWQLVAATPCASARNSRIWACLCKGTAPAFLHTGTAEGLQAPPTADCHCSSLAPSSTNLSSRATPRKQHLTQGTSERAPQRVAFIGVTSRTSEILFLAGFSHGFPHTTQSASRGVPHSVSHTSKVPHRSNFSRELPPYLFTCSSSRQCLRGRPNELCTSRVSGAVQRQFVTSCSTAILHKSGWRDRKSCSKAAVPRALFFLAAVPRNFLKEAPCTLGRGFARTDTH